MPAKKMYRRKRIKRKIRRKPRSLPRGLSPAIMHFKRSRHEIVNAGIANLGWILGPGTGGTSTLSKVFTFSLGQLNDSSDFANLFKYYKINGVACKIWSCNTTTNNAVASGAGYVPNSQLLIRYDTNQDGVQSLTSKADDPQTYMNSQTSKVKRLTNGQGRPVKMYMKMKQSSALYDSSTTLSTNYALQFPKWVSTTDKGVDHYGYQLLIQRSDDSAFTTGYNNNQTLRFEYTYYISCKKVE